MIKLGDFGRYWLPLAGYLNCFNGSAGACHTRKSHERFFVQRLIPKGKYGETSRAFIPFYIAVAFEFVEKINDGLV